MRCAALMFVCLAWGLAFAGQSDQIDRSFTARGDIKGDGQKETLTIHITAASIDAPFKWTVTIADAMGAIIFRVDRDDSWLDKFFRDKGYEVGCADYASCKKRYYFQDIPKAVFAAIRPSTTAWEFNGFTKSNLENTVTADLTEHGTPSEDITAAIDEMRATLRKPGFHVLEIPISPVKSGAPMIWVQKVNRFVPYYQE